ncbi:hypothetical protein [Lignipirellula cremea]|uniref:Uncharacterized protein n=1 Tax=Lignipirellula cremea TaxID=2528010 RepID=A0A518DWY3_9BACT|nr:hypothetical protein [Lignipirellula cremea]QDU96343.1 hypothetical protein Pla8534_41630 [Lignipirellula cremea]
MSPCLPAFCISLCLLGADAPEHAAPGVTSLTNPQVKFERTDQHAIVLQRAGVTAVIVDNHAVDTAEAPGHRAGYNGVAALRHTRQPLNIFCSPYAGLNFEHIHDGTLAISREKFEPRKAPLELRKINAHTVELYQPPTPNWKLESCGRYELLEDGVLQYTLECIPRANHYRHDYIGLFWASYIDAPADKAIHFRGREKDTTHAADWIRAVTPAHGVDSTHPPDGPAPTIKVDDDFPLTLVNHRSKYRHAEPWYYGVCRGMALVQMFRPTDQIWFAQSPTGGGADNPAWDFQWFIPHPQVGQTYRFVMRAAYLPYENREQIERATASHRKALAEPSR